VRYSTVCSCEGGMIVSAAVRYSTVCYCEGDTIVSAAVQYSPMLMCLYQLQCITVQYSPCVRVICLYQLQSSVLQYSTAEGVRLGWLCSLDLLR
jgi:hypothetical protein